MLTRQSLVQEAVLRAKAVNLAQTITALAKDGEETNASSRQIENRRITLMRNVDDPLAARIQLERIMQGNELTDINYLAKGVAAARSVCRIVIRKNGRTLGYGTGFLVAPGVLMTNEHVFPQSEYVNESMAQFRFERDLRGNDLAPAEFMLNSPTPPIISRELDVAIVAVQPRSVAGEQLDTFGWLQLKAQAGKAFVGEYLTIIQHPNGERKQICVRENKLLKYSENGPYIWYQTDTVGGSSGSPVFNNNWDVVALHHSSVPRTKKVDGQDVWLARDGKVWAASMGDDQVDWMANEGIRISRIVQYLRMEHATHPLAQAILGAAEFQPQESTGNFSGTSAPHASRVDSSGNVHLVIPIEIGISVGIAGQQSAPSIPPATTIEPDMPVHSTAAVEKVLVDQSDYNKRNGFNPKFLGNNLVVPLPTVKGKVFGKVAKFSGNKTELKYWNYSVVMNEERRLAYFSAANVDSKQFKGERDKAGDTWYFDTRIDNAYQLGKEFYKKQSKFEADRTLNPFDQGHLTRRKDLQWGDTDELAKRNGDDSFHYTNCSPQHWQFNQNSKVNGIWFRLEEAAITTLSSGDQLCVINGPVFDAPLCKVGSDGMPQLNLKGKRSKDGSFGGVQIPKCFFKVIAYRDGNLLSARAFVVTQEDLLATIDRYYTEAEAIDLTEREVHLFQVSIPELEKLTGLDFGGLSTADTSAKEWSEAAHLGIRIEELADIRF